MAEVDEHLLVEALSAHGADDVGPIGAPGGQKAVRHVEIGGESKIMKVISLKEASPEMLKRAEREVTLLRSLSCPNVVAVESDLIELGIPPYGATWLEEFLDGEDLSGLLGSPWDWEDVRLMGLQIAVALSAAHQVGVVHRDLSANNVRRLSNGDFRVLDFGFARHTLLSGVTIAGQPGTLGFCSPEHLNGYSGGPMPASDVFCVGILMYTALAGESPIPYLGDSDDYLHRLMNVEFVPLSEVCAGIPDDLTKVVERCLHRQPARRFVNGTRLAEALGGELDDRMD